MRALAKLGSVIVLGAALASASSCEKGDTANPGEAAEADAGGAAAGELLRYKLGEAKLVQSTKLSTKLRGGGQTGALTADFKAEVSVADAGGDKLKVSYAVTDVGTLDVSGALQPKGRGGEPPPDPKEVFKRVSGAFVIDARGELDEEATKALPENAKLPEKKEDELTDEERLERRARMLRGLMAVALQFPTLPKKALAVGSPVTTEDQSEQSLGGAGPKLPIESETTVTLIKVDDGAGKRHAEVSVEVEASGAAEMQGGMLTVDQSIEGTLVFNMDDGLPVSTNLTVSGTFGFGDQGQESTTTIETTYAPAT